MKRILLAAALFALALPALSSAQETEVLKARFRDRRPALDLLKDQGSIGENNRGLVEHVGAARPGEDVVAAENADRQELYATIAASTETTPDLVGRRRALKIAAQEPAGRMLQNAQGEWYKKP